MEEDNLIGLIEESQKITSALATIAYELTPLQVAWIVGKVKHAYKLKLGQFAEEAFKAEQRANKLAAEWGLAQIEIAELRNEVNRLTTESQYKWNEGDDEHS